MNKYEWLEKRVLRSVDNLRLWPDNPRLNPEEKHINLADYVTDLFSDNSERNSFNKLVDSIATEGFIPADPIVVWRNTENNKYYVAEGNRRVLALKLLRTPDKAPLIARNYIFQKSKLIDRNLIEKIRVNVAPSFEEAEWYINQRHAGSSLQRSWSRLQQLRWVADLYEKHHGNISHIRTITKLSKSDLDNIFRILKIRDYASHDLVKNLLTTEEYEKVQSHRIPITILERWFLDTRVRNKWGIEFVEEQVNISSNFESFLCAYAKFLQLVIHRGEPDVEIKIDTRTIDSNFEEILKSLPSVSTELSSEPFSAFSSGDTSKDNSANTNEEGDEGKNGTDNGKPNQATPPLFNKNPIRPNLVIPNCELSTSNYKLKALFFELKRIPLSRYPHSIAVTLRVFLDIAIGEYIRAEGMEEEINSQYHKSQLSDIGLINPAT